MRFIRLLGIALFVFSCGLKDKAWKSQVEKVITDKIGKKLIIPDSLELFIDNSFSVFLSKSLDDHLKIVGYIDANCGACLMNFSFWKDFMGEINRKNINCNVYLFVNIDKNNINTIQKMGFDYPFILDCKSSFAALNDLWDKRFQTALLNGENEVILIGDPTLNPALRDLYMEVILEKQ